MKQISYKTPEALRSFQSWMIVFFSITAVIASLPVSAQNDPQPYQGVVGKTLADSKEWWPEPLKAPAGSPNIVWVLLDDVGFGASSTFGGLISTPNFDTLASQGLRYTNFHTAGICAPTRAALLTGRNHHYVHMGNFAHTGTSAGFPGYDGRIPPDKGTIAEVLRENGYNTFAVGKYGVTPDEDTTDAGPFDRWPTGKGFDHFFGFLESQSDQYAPAHLVEDNAHTPTDGRNLNEQITDKAVGYIDRQHKAAPDKPFFLYFAPGATHAPHQVTTQWSDPYRGKFDDGWDAYREKVIVNQKKLGIVPANAVLPPRNELIPAWNTLSADEKKLYARFMEVYAGYLTYIDHQVGRVLQHLKETGQFDNTLVLVVIGDNGASKEGREEGVINQTFMTRSLDREESIKKNLAEIDKIGTPEGHETNYPLGWAQAANTPFKYWKQDANAEGGTRNPLIVYYPKLIKDKGGIRSQYGHVIDLLPTTVALAGLKLPAAIKGIKQDTLQGLSLAYSIADAKAPSRHAVQYYYIFGSRSIYKDGWKAEALHHPNFLDLTRSPAAAASGAASGNTGAGPAAGEKSYEKDTWELYDLTTDFNERNDLSKKYPEKLTELKQLFDAEAQKNHVYPFIDFEDVFKRRIHHTNNSK